MKSLQIPIKMDATLYTISKLLWFVLPFGDKVFHCLVAKKKAFIEFD